MAKFLPCGDTADFEYRVDLEGDGYDIRTRWNSRSGSWFIYIGPTGREPVVKARACTLSDMLRTYRGKDGVPQGKLYVVDNEKGYGRPSRNDFGINKRFRLLYVNSTEDDPFLQI